MTILGSRNAAGERKELTDEVVKQYWDGKASEKGDQPEVTIKDFRFRELEIEVIEEHIGEGDRILDVGCGNGYSTLEYARRTKNQVVGLDYSEPMIEAAIRYHSAHHPETGNIKFLVGDARHLPFEDDSFDIVVMQRCLINIPDREEQKKAADEVHRVLESGGKFLLAEVTLQGHKNLNRLRNRFGLGNVKVHWHNTYVDEGDLLAHIKNGFEVRDIYRFGMYNLISKVIHPLMVAPEEPKFDAKINEVAKIIGKEFINFEDASHQVLFYLEKK